jgi:polyadenylate-binding protein 2
MNNIEEVILYRNNEEKNNTIKKSLETMRNRIKKLEKEANRLELDQIGELKNNSIDFTKDLEIDKRSIYVGNVDYSSKPDDLKRFFSTCGQLERVTIICDKWTGQPKGYAYVQFSTKEGVENAILLDCSEFKGRAIKVIPKRTNIFGFNREKNRIRKYDRSYYGRKHCKYRSSYQSFKNKKTLFQPYFGET